METIFKKYFWVIQVIGLAAATGLAASALVTQLGTSFVLTTVDDPKGAKPKTAGDKDGDAEGGDEGDDEEGQRGSARTRAADRAQRSARRAQAQANTDKRNQKKAVSETILARNIFCPTCNDEEEAITDATTPSSQAGSPLAGEGKTSLPLQLMATMEAEDAELSLATIHDTEAGWTGLFGVNDEVRLGVTVVGIETGIVHLRNRAALEYLELGEVQKPKRGSTAKPKAEQPSTRRPSSAAIEGAEDAINCSGDSCTVDRAFVEKLMADPAMLAKQARIVPSKRGGETQGFKFYGIRRGSLPRLLGLKNGDMLTEVNGEALDSVDQAMGLAIKLRQASNLSVSIVRKGQTIRKEITIQ